MKKGKRKKVKENAPEYQPEKNGKWASSCPCLCPYPCSLLWFSLPVNPFLLFLPFFTGASFLALFKIKNQNSQQQRFLQLQKGNQNEIRNDIQNQTSKKRKHSLKLKKPKIKNQELDLKNLIEPKYVDETLDGEVSKQIQASDGFVLKVVNIERGFKSEDANYKLDTSKELVKVNFLIGNTDKSKSKDQYRGLFLLLAGDEISDSTVFIFLREECIDN